MSMLLLGRTQLGEQSRLLPEAILECSLVHGGIVCRVPGMHGGGDVGSPSV
jgi:hypothetical protein